MIAVPYRQKEPDRPFSGPATQISPGALASVKETPIEGKSMACAKAFGENPCPHMCSEARTTGSSPPYQSISGSKGSFMFTLIFCIPKVCADRQSAGNQRLLILFHQI